MNVDRNTWIKRAAEKKYKSTAARLAFISGAEFADKYPDWNSVLDVMPQEYEQVLTFSRKSGKTTTARYSERYGWFDDASNYIEPDIWMPLPYNPYKKRVK
jgi:hypothetical protein